ncbi:MAG TPA: hypothetical protein VJT72_03925 [Pseudonocardiaceae bacterium]|nr:hypothetical protein [Pseudonocardiaceae bacterium]
MESVVAGRVELECHLDEWGAFGVDVDGADFAALVGDADVFVADFCYAERAAVFGFLAHLVFDVFAGYQDLVFVEDGDHAVHGASGGAFVEVLFCGGDECHAELVECHHHDRVVVSVAGEAGECVDDDVANVWVGFEVGDHFSEGVAVLDRFGGLAGVGELGDEDGAEFFRAGGDGFALGGKGDAFGVEVGLYLPE